MPPPVSRCSSARSLASEALRTAGLLAADARGSSREALQAGSIVGGRPGPGCVWHPGSWDGAPSSPSGGDCRPEAAGCASIVAAISRQLQLRCVSTVACDQAGGTRDPKQIVQRCRVRPLARGLEAAQLITCNYVQNKAVLQAPDQRSCPSLRHRCESVPESHACTPGIRDRALRRLMKLNKCCGSPAVCTSGTSGSKLSSKLELMRA